MRDYIYIVLRAGLWVNLQFRDKGMWLYLQCGEMGCFHVYSVWREVPWFYFNCRDRGNVVTFTVCGYGGSGYI